ncbi:MAG: hypothetical protein ACE3JK_11535 [Sporolactobacillus sp.]
MTTIIRNEKAIYEIANSYVNKCLQALQIVNHMVFHLEVFLKPRTNEFVFLEIAGRYPGSGITGLIESVFHIDLVKMSYAIDCLDFTLEDLQGAVYPGDIPNSVGRVLMPTPLKRNLCVKSITGLDKVPNTIIRSTITGPGNIVLFDPIDAFQSVCEFTIADSTKEQVIQSINRLNKTIQFTYDEV